MDALEGKSKSKETVPVQTSKAKEKGCKETEASIKSNKK